MEDSQNESNGEPEVEETDSEKSEEEIKPSLFLQLSETAKEEESPNKSMSSHNLQPK